MTILIRRDSLTQTMSRYLIDEIHAAPNIEVRPHTEVIGCSGDGALEAVTLRDCVTGRSETVRAAALFILIGAEPHTSCLPPDIRRNRWGYVLTGADRPAGSWPLVRPPLTFETSLPGVFAVGDARDGSTKRVASAVGEGSVVIEQVHQLLEAAKAQGRLSPAASRG